MQSSIRNKGYGDRETWMQAEPRVSYISSVSLSFLICKMGIIIELPTWGCCENEMQNFKVLAVFVSPGTFQALTTCIHCHYVFVGYFHICKVMAFVNLAIQTFKRLMCLCDFRLYWF